MLWRGKKRGMASKPGIKQMGKAKEIEVHTMARRSLHSKGMEQVGTIRKEWVRGIPLKIKLSGGIWWRW